MNEAINRSGSPVFRTDEMKAATITPIFPMASFLEQSQTDLILASPFLYFSNNNTLITFAQRARNPINPIISVLGVVGDKNSKAVEIATQMPIPNRLKPFSEETKTLVFFVEPMAKRESP